MVDPESFPADSRRSGTGFIDKDKVRDKVHEVADQAKSMYQSAKERAMELEGTFEKSVQDRPLRSVLIAAGVGLVIGVLVGRR